MAGGSYFEVTQGAVHSLHWNSLAGGCRTMPTAQKKGSFPCICPEADCGSRRRKAEVHSAARVGRERQAMPWLWAEQKQGVTKAKDKAQGMHKRSKH